MYDTEISKLGDLVEVKTILVLSKIGYRIGYKHVVHYFATKPTTKIYNNCKASS